MQMKRILHGGPAVQEPHPSTPASGQGAKKSPTSNAGAEEMDADNKSVADNEEGGNQRHLEGVLDMTDLQLLVIIFGWIVQVLQTFYIWGKTDRLRLRLRHRLESISRLIKPE